jgi:hypothetical protein
MKTKIFPLLVATVILLTACGNCPPFADEARIASEQFFLLLSQGKYTEADRLFGGDYQPLVDQNPSLDPANHAALWQAACTINGFQCLETYSVSYVDKQDDVFTFKVEFKNPDGGKFSAPTSEGDAQTEFTFRVKKAAGFEYASDIEYQVIDLPVYLQ